MNETLHEWVAANGGCNIVGKQEVTDFLNGWPETSCCTDCWYLLPDTTPLSHLSEVERDLLVSDPKDFASSVEERTSKVMKALGACTGEVLPLLKEGDYLSFHKESCGGHDYVTLRVQRFLTPDVVSLVASLTILCNA